MTQSRNLEIPSLDGLRTISIAVVFLAHAGLDRIVPGGFGVTVFFVLSGFLITTLLRTELDKHGRISIKQFYVRRVFRILPLFYAVLTVVLLCTLWFGLGTGRAPVGSTVAQYAHVTNYWAILRPDQLFMNGTGVYWSLAVEEHFYLLFPLAMVLINRAGLSYRTQARWLLAVSAAVLVWRLVLVYGLDASINRTYLASDTRVDSLLIGCAVALGANPVLDTVVAPKALAKRAFIGLVVILATFAVRNDGFRETLRYSLQSVAIASCLMYVVAVPQSAWGRLLNWRPMVWFGQLTYGFYLVHFVTLYEVRKHLHGVLAGVVAFVVALGVAMVFRAVVERPAHTVRNRVLAAIRQPTTSPAVAL